MANWGALLQGFANTYFPARQRAKDRQKQEELNELQKKLKQNQLEQSQYQLEQQKKKDFYNNLLDAKKLGGKQAIENVAQNNIDKAQKIGLVSNESMPDVRVNQPMPDNTEDLGTAKGLMESANQPIKFDVTERKPTKDEKANQLVNLMSNQNQTSTEDARKNGWIVDQDYRKKVKNDPSLRVRPHPTLDEAFKVTKDLTYQPSDKPSQSTSSSSSSIQGYSFGNYMDDFKGKVTNKWTDKGVREGWLKPVKNWEGEVTNYKRTGKEGYIPFQDFAKSEWIKFNQRNNATGSSKSGSGDGTDTTKFNNMVESTVSEIENEAESKDITPKQAYLNERDKLVKNGMEKMVKRLDQKFGVNKGETTKQPDQSNNQNTTKPTRNNQNDKISLLTTKNTSEVSAPGEAEFNKERSRRFNQTMDKQLSKLTEKSDTDAKQPGNPNREQVSLSIDEPLMQQRLNKVQETSSDIAESNLGEKLDASLKNLSEPAINVLSNLVNNPSGQEMQNQINPSDNKEDVPNFGLEELKQLASIFVNNPTGEEVQQRVDQEINGDKVFTLPLVNNPSGQQVQNKVEDIISNEKVFNFPEIPLVLNPKGKEVQNQINPSDTNQNVPNLGTEELIKALKFLTNNPSGQEMQNKINSIIR